MGVIKVVLVLDDTILAQQTLLGQINAALASIASNIPLPGAAEYRSTEDKLG